MDKSNQNLLPNGRQRAFLWTALKATLGVAGVTALTPPSVKSAVWKKMREK